MTLECATREWLLDTDPALRWQVERDIVGAPAAVWQGTRKRVATEGMGARLLALQDPDGRWAGGAYFPGRRDERAVDPAGDPGKDQGQPWTATTWSLNSLREWGVYASHLAGTAELLKTNCRWEYDDLPYWGGEVDCCINGYTLANGTWLGADVNQIVDWFLDHQLPDGGWNCEWENGSTHSSVHSTLNSLNGLLYHETAAHRPHRLSASKDARAAAQEYLLERRGMFKLSSGERLGPWLSRFSYPFRWQYNVLRAADYFYRAAQHDETPADARLADLMETIAAKQQPDGAWHQDAAPVGQVWFEMDVPEGEPSPWLTFHAARALGWWSVAGVAE